jgi:hypothetical protein
MVTVEQPRPLEVLSCAQRCLHESEAMLRRAIAAGMPPAAVKRVARFVIEAAVMVGDMWRLCA